MVLIKDRSIHVVDYLLEVCLNVIFIFISLRLSTFHVLSHLGLHVLLEAHSMFLEKAPVLVGWGLT